MAGTNSIFMPASNTSTLAVTASTTSAGGTLTGRTQSEDSVRVFNSTSAIAYIRFTNGSSTAVTTDMPVAPGATEMFGISPDTTHATVILSGAPSGSALVFFTVGKGV